MANRLWTFGDSIYLVVKKIAVQTAFISGSFRTAKWVLGCFNYLRLAASGHRFFASLRLRLCDLVSAPNRTAPFMVCLKIRWVVGLEVCFFNQIGGPTCQYVLQCVVLDAATELLGVRCWKILFWDLHICWLKLLWLLVICLCVLCAFRCTL